MGRSSVLRVTVIVLVGAFLAAAVYYAPAYFITESQERPTTQMKTGGTDNVHILMVNRWRTAYRNETGVEVDYDSIGSTKGIAAMIDGTYPVAFTHAPLTPEQKKKAQEKGGEVVHIPVTVCAVVPVYHLKQLKDKPPLKFTGEVLADIFLGKIQTWNDPALKKINEGVPLPDTKITVVHREDSSGTTVIFTDYLAGASQAWRSKVGPAKPEITWPAGVGKKRSTGVAGHVARTEGAIGYVDLLHALNFELSYGAVQNSDATAFLQAAADNMTATVRGMVKDIPDDLTFSATNRPGKGSYPICSAIWAVCYRKQPASSRGEVVGFLRWVNHEGQKFASTSSYAPLPPELVARVDKKLEAIQAAE
jgi:phosphate transport system substrate-binding protein